MSEVVLHEKGNAQAQAANAAAKEEATYVVLFSGGVASWAAARRTVEAHGIDVTTLLFTDTLSEDEDLYRFLDEAAADVGAPLVRIAEGRTIWEVFRDEKFLGNTRVDPCSRVLKREQSRRWLTENAPRATIVFGYDWTEIHRLEKARAAWAPWPIEAPMAEKPYLTRTEMFAELERRGIKMPRLYGLGMDHNNCGGGCVKAGQSHFVQLLRVFPARFAEWERHENEMRDQLGDVSILRDRTDDETKPLPLSVLRERAEAGVSLPLWDIGGCACFEEPVA